MKKTELTHNRKKGMVLFINEIKQDNTFGGGH